MTFDEHINRDKPENIPGPTFRDLKSRFLRIKPRKYGEQFSADQVREIAVRVYGPAAETWSRAVQEMMLEEHDAKQKEHL